MSRITNLFRLIVQLAVGLTALVFVLACAFGPILLLFAVHDWTLGPEESDMAVALVVAGNGTGIAGCLIVTRVGRFFTRDKGEHE
ncbi:hypothetical protein LCGC14_0249950 [marine sediment metagenome]|uniref:Uncharacterized protein n=1 Tax=marine sediment metagenome TaxID=412755 RepID=A0A0F9ULU0_9ZZZZ